MSTKPEPKKTKGMCIATRCTSVEQFIQMFHRFVDEESFFVSTLNTRPAGLETSFSVQLVDGTPVLRGLCVVMQAWTDSSNPFKTPGVRLGIKRLTANSMVVFEQLLITRSAKTPASSGGTPLPIKPIATKPLAGATPGTPVVPKTLPGATPVGPKTIPGAPAVATPPATKPFGPPKLKMPASIAVGVPKTVPAKTPFSETAPTKHAPSRVELSQPARPSSEPADRTIPDLGARTEEPERGASEPIPEAISPEPTDVIEEKTDVREPKQPVAMLGTPPAPPKADAPVLAARDLAAELQLEKPDATGEARTPGSDLVLPANPLMNLTDASLEGYVDCTLYEETGNFFPADDEAAADFVDDVVPPPVATRTDAPAPGVHERQRTITPLPAAPDIAAGAPAAADVVPTRESAPSIIVPPPMPAPAMPRDSVMVDPALIARGSTPAFEPEAKPPVDTPTFTKDGVQKPSFDGTALPLPAKPTSELAPLRRKRPPLWMLGGAVGLLGVAIVVVVSLTSKSDGSSTPAPAAKPANELAEVVPPAKKTQAAVATDETGDVEDVEDIDDGHEGPPIVGEGPCQVVVATTPAGSMVAIDGKTVGPSPLTVGATCGPHKLDISHARYQATSKTVTLTAGKPHELEVTLQRPTHTVTVTSNPSGATIFIDGRSAGTTPTKLNVLGFVTIKLELKKTGYQPAKTKLYSKRAQDQVAVRLTKW